MGVKTGNPGLQSGQEFVSGVGANETSYFQNVATGSGAYQFRRYPRRPAALVAHTAHFAAGAIAIALFVFGKLRSTATAAVERIGSWARGAGAWRTLRLERRS